MNTRHSTHSKSASKPKKPLTLHASGQWCKKILGKIHYFGRDYDKVLNRWLDEKDDLLAGRLPRSRTIDANANRLRDLVLVAAKQP